MAVSRKTWLISSVAAGALLAYLLGPFIYLPYLLSHMHDQPPPPSKLYSLLYGKVIDGSHNDPYNTMFRRYAVWQCSRYPGACIDPVE